MYIYIQMRCAQVRHFFLFKKLIFEVLECLWGSLGKYFGRPGSVGTPLGSLGQSKAGSRVGPGKFQGHLGVPAAFFRACGMICRLGIQGAAWEGHWRFL